jgi:tRNA(Ile)-lysidine synthase
MKQHQLIEQFKKHCKDHFPDLPKENVLLAISGGCDSMVLAHLFLAAGIKFAIAHCNYRLRGEDSDADAALVRGFSEEWQLNFHYNELNSFEGKSKNGLQERARQVRYEWFEELCASYGYTVVATAHHANDSAETLLMNLAKGTGIRGLHGIPERNGRIIRPLLFAGRHAIRQFASDEGIAYREDRSNDSDDYSRNAVRHHVIPALEQIFPQTVSAIAHSIQYFRGAETYYRMAIEQERKKILQQRGADVYIPIRRLLLTADVPTMLLELLLPYGFSAAQTQEALKLLTAESGHWINSDSHKIVKDRDFLIICRLNSEQTDVLIIPEEQPEESTPEGIFRFTRIEEADLTVENPNCIFVDAAKLQFPLLLRRRRTGDYFYPRGFGKKKKKISKLLIDKKVSLPDKEKVWILCSGPQIVWVAGFRADERFQCGKGTKSFLKIEFLPKG